MIGIRTVMTICLLATALQSSVWAQKLNEVIHIEGYFNSIDHKAVIFNTSLSCDSLGLKDWSGRNPEPDALVCYSSVYSGNDLVLYDYSGVSVMMDSTGRLYSKDQFNPKATPYYLNVHIDQLLKGRRDILVEADGSASDSLVLRAVPLKDYRLGRVNKTGSNHIAIFYDHFTYPAKGELSPEDMNELLDGIQMIPEDGKVEDKLVLIIPIDKVDVPGTFSLYIFDLKGNILRMYTNLDKVENILYRENFMSGTYKYAIYFDNGKIEIKKGMLNFIEPPKPE